jgi:hypothetical protein
MVTEHDGAETTFAVGVGEMEFDAGVRCEVGPGLPSEHCLDGSERRREPRRVRQLRRVRVAREMCDGSCDQCVVHVRDKFHQLVIHCPASRGKQTAIPPSVADWPLMRCTRGREGFPKILQAWDSDGVDRLANQSIRVQQHLAS